MKDAFSTYHPILNFGYFTFVILVSMFCMHPVFLTISFIGAFIYSIKLNGKKAVKFNLLCGIPILVISAIANPLFVHEGVTILTYFSSGNPLTLESIVYGISTSVMLVSVIMWFSCYNKIMTSDKFIYIFGKIIPGMSLILSMILRFVPKYKSQIKIISKSQKSIGRDVSNGNIIQRSRYGLKILSVMTTWALENGVETADSMKARGYGLKGRTNFSNFRFDSRDKKFTALALCLVVTFLIGIYSGCGKIRFYPSIVISSENLQSVLTYTSYALFCIIPVVIDIVEEIRWKRLRLRI
ncbi:energy-coupling factor transporter transmembrane protein EcfT [Sedimentibacter sp. zth1]|uniref:energy-coupling factor transporter transmembrane component T n=1 Tax=Sedimentibacter sp. zth1 TaxID=2816908 RepID=UPI001A939342|nr:energy-coupling factor transporter transmembrane component T [Sedimentibacter sp. zth1]QSX04858.1 energy-coupling factor transporter transmembrane protein EcfT [Sedimentibacter sp. zth1]